MGKTAGKYRLVTRNDFDGLVCAVLLRQMDMIDEIKFVHPKDMQDGIIEITDNDIIANLPFVEGAHMVFDHHHSETVRIKTKDNCIIDEAAPSAASVICKYYGGPSNFDVDQALLDAVDKADSANLSIEDVTNPDGWMTLNFIMDARTGLGRFRDFSISTHGLMMELIDLCQTESIGNIMRNRNVTERVEFYLTSQEQFIDQLKRCANIEGNVVELDLRNEETIWPGNRFYIYTLFPDCNISMHVLSGKDKQNTVFAIGKSIFNKTSNTNVGELCLSYGGGGHVATGTCQIENQHAVKVRDALIARMNMDG